MILLKCVKAYLQMAQDHHDAAIWNLVPEYFKTIQTQVAMVTNTLHNFMASEKVRFGQDLFVPQKVFTASFNIHCTENNLGRQKFNQDLYQGPFGSRDIEVRNESKIYKGRVYPTQPFIFGLDIIDEGIQMNDEDR
jgi:hypothetical protein